MVWIALESTIINQYILCGHSFNMGETVFGPLRVTKATSTIHLDVFFSGDLCIKSARAKIYIPAVFVNELRNL